MRLTHVKSIKGPWFDMTVFEGEHARRLTTIHWQDGPIKEHGVNGVQIDDVVRAALEFLQAVNGPFPCRQNSLVITKLEEVLFWLRDRTEERERRGVEGKSQE
jgi:hypothetical protein